VPFGTPRLNLGFQQGDDTTVTQVAGQANRLGIRARMSVRWRSSKAVGHHPALKALAYKAFRRLPVKRGLVVFESHLGKQYSDSPRYIYEAAAAAGLDRLRAVPVRSHPQCNVRV